MIWSIPCGAYTVYAIEDGWLYRDPQDQFPQTTAGDWGPQSLEEGLLRVSLGCFLVTDGIRNVMVDAGIGNLAGAVGGRAVGGQLAQGLALIGVRPEEVQTVGITHLHLDHVGGLLAPNGEPFFPNATLHVHRRELDHWMETEEHPETGAVRGIVERFVDEGKVEPLSGDEPIAPGVTTVSTPGHTPGHVSFEVASQGSRCLIAGDATHHPVQVQRPDWSVATDDDPRTATRTREEVFAGLAGTGAVLAAGHYPRPGLGYVEVVSGVPTFVTGTAIQVA